MGRPVDLTGAVFGALTVVGLAPRESHPTGLRCWLCRCTCGREEPVLTSQLTRCGRTCCLACSGRLRPNGARRARKACAACGRDFAGDVNAKVCSAECREARRRGAKAGVAALPPPSAECPVCGATFRVTRGSMRCCSAGCRAERRRQKRLAAWYRRVAREPGLARRMAERRRARALADPGYALKVREWQRTRQANRRAKLRADPEYAARVRARENAFYARHAGAIQAARRARLDAMAPAELAGWAARARAYGRRYRCKYREALAADPPAHQRYLDLMREYRRRRNALRTLFEAARLAAELEDRADG